MAIQKRIYDFVFIGLGASNSLILLSLIKRGLTKNKQIAVFEVDSKTKNDKTYCFWASPDEPIVTELSSIISLQFNNIRVNSSSVENIANCPYHYIRSIDLYTTAFEMLQKAEIEVHRSAVSNVISENESYTIQTADETYRSKYIFDSRPPLLDEINKEDIYLHQSFFGLHIKCENDVFQKDTFEMMNFNIEQNNFTQFVYVIPFSSQEALVELTRFGNEKIELASALHVLEEFISKEFGKYEKIGEEIGCIPMTTFRNPVNPSEGILNTGASANIIKPSTGYGFKNMFYFAQLVTERVAAENLDKFNKINIHSKARFKFYDNLLLIILLQWPSFGKKIFTRLFNKVPILTIFSFLEEKTSLREEIKIFTLLPIQPFMKALYRYLKKKTILRYIIAFMVVIIYTALSFIHIPTANNFNYVLLIIGLVWIGIPHGALDHLLSTNKKTSIPIFIFNYLFIMIAYLLFWQFFPIISLLVFVAYSSFHFGESELIQNKEQLNTLSKYLKAFLFGLSILLFIISTHLEESLHIISTLNNASIIVPVSLHIQTWSIVVSLISLTYILLNCLLSKSLSFIGLLVLLILGVQVPLLMAFGLYFIAQHSYNAWSHLKQGLNMSSRELYLKSSLLTFSALLLFIFMAFFIRESIDLVGFWANFFIFIACISLPHFLLMHRFYLSKKEIK